MSLVFQALRRHYPHGYIEAIGPVERLQLINTPGLINTVTSHDWPGVSELYIPGGSLSARLIPYIQQFDTIVWYGVDAQRIVTQNLCKICAHGVFRFDPFPPPGENIHIAAYLLQTLVPIGIQRFEGFPEIALPNPAASVSRLSNPMSHSHLRIAVHPGSGSPQKNWDSANFAELCRRMWQVFSAQIVLLGGPAEKDALHSIRSRVPEQAVTLVQDVPLLILAEVLRACDVYLGNDSGITHLAAALGIPTIALFGVSNPVVWRPLGKRVVVLHAGNQPYCADISVEQVWTSLQVIVRKLSDRSEAETWIEPIAQPIPGEIKT